MALSPDTRDGVVKAFLRSGHWPTLLSAFLYFDVSFMVWVLIGALGVFISQDLGLSASEKGLLVALPVLTGALLRVPVGITADRFGPRRVGALGLAVTCVPLLLGWRAAASAEGVFVTALLLGVAGSSFAVALPLASRWYPPQQQGLVMGIAGAGNSGTAIAALAAPRLAERYGWHEVFGLALLPVVGILIVYLPPGQGESPPAPSPTTADVPGGPPRARSVARGNRPGGSHGRYRRLPLARALRDAQGRRRDLAVFV
jgi:NNP family nitrate/nitrite transporter-like MFS transporter